MKKVRAEPAGAVGSGEMLSKVPQVTVFFWVIKVLCTTVGETASDFLNVNLGWGLKGTSIAAGIALAIVLVFQSKARRYIPGIYWLAVVLISIFGTLVTDILTDSVGFPLEASTLIFSAALAATFGVWYVNEKTLSIHSIFTTRREAFYWLAILFTFALGTAAGDLMAEKLGLGYVVTGLIVLAIIAAAGIGSRLGLNKVLAFWIAYILTRPLGASLGDYLSQSRLNGGLGLGAPVTSAVFLLAILIVVIYLGVTRRDFIADPQAEEAPEGNHHSAIWQVVAVVLILAVGGGLGYYLRKAQLQRQAAASITPNAPLGDLSNFRAIGVDMLAKVRSGDMAGAKAGADDLETAWDNSQARLQPMNPDKWTMLDNATDGVLKSVRAGQADASTTALVSYVHVIDTLGERAKASPVSPSPAASGDSSQTLGDLSAFRTISNDMLQSVTKGDAAGVKTKAKALEDAWDAAQPNLQPRNPAKWTAVDTAIDAVLKKARSTDPTGPDTQTAIQELLKVIDSTR